MSWGFATRAITGTRLEECSSSACFLGVRDQEPNYLYILETCFDNIAMDKKTNEAKAPDVARGSCKRWLLTDYGRGYCHV